MRKSALTAALVATHAVPAFAGDLTGYKITKRAEHPCDIQVARVYQSADMKLHVALHNNDHSGTAVGKLMASTKVGTKLTMDGTDFKLDGGEYKDYVANKDPKGAVAGSDVMLSFQSCNVMMH